MADIKLLRYCTVFNSFLTFIGLILSLYAVYVEMQKEVRKNYVAYCDINEVMSCSKVFASKYAKGFGLVGPLLGSDSILNQPNGIYGTVMYSLLFTLSQTDSKGIAVIQKWLVILCNCMTPYLAYLLYKVIHAVCVVCVATYAVNFLLLCVAFLKVKAINSPAKGRTKRD